MPVDLKLVSTRDQVRDSLVSFNAEARSYPARALSLLRQTTYFVYDDAGCFGPAKYLGFVGMTFPKYEQAVKQDHTGDPFDGFASRRAIESALATAFAPDEQLSLKLRLWAESLFGPGVFEEVDEAKWSFVRAAVARNYWALMANPEMYDIQRAVAELTEDDWLVHRSDVKMGDRVAIWKAKGRSTQRGVVALGEVLTNPATMLPQPGHEKYYLDPALMTAERRVVVRYVLPPRVPVWLGNDGSGALDDLSVAHATGGTVFKILPDQWRRLLEAVGGWPISQARPDDAAVEAADALRSKNQGFQSDPVVRQAVEQYAMKQARSHFSKLGYSVEVVGKPYDLQCKKEASVMYVEVKGTQTEGAEILLTPNEVEFANTHQDEMALFVLHDISVSYVDGKIVLCGGTVHLEPNWMIDESRLSPLAYSYSLSEGQKTPT